MARALTDVLRLAVAVGSLLVVVLIGALFDEAIVGFVADLVQGIEALPVAGHGSDRHWPDPGDRGAGGRCCRRGGAPQLIVLALAAAAAAVAVLLTLVILLLVDDVAPQVAKVDEPTPVAPGPGRVHHGIGRCWRPWSAASPWIARRWRRAGWTVAIIATLTRFLGAQIEFDTLRRC